MTEIHPIESFSEILQQILVLVHYPQEKIDSFIDNTVQTSFTNCVLDLKDTISITEKISLTTVLNDKDFHQAQEVLIQKFGQEKYTQVLITELQKTLRSLIDELSSEVSDEQKKVLETLYQDFLHTS